MGEFSQKIALVRAEDDEGLEDEYAVSVCVHVCTCEYMCVHRRWNWIGHSPATLPNSTSTKTRTATSTSSPVSRRLCVCVHACMSMCVCACPCVGVQVYSTLHSATITSISFSMSYCMYSHGCMCMWTHLSVYACVHMPLHVCLLLRLWD